MNDEQTLEALRQFYNAARQVAHVLEGQILEEAKISQGEPLLRLILPGALLQEVIRRTSLQARMSIAHRKEELKDAREHEAWLLEQVEELEAKVNGAKVAP